MLQSYFQNSSVGMTKEAYFDMCEMLGSEPIESEIPVEHEDFPIEVQEAIELYHRLRDDWDTMNGVYLGKSFVGLRDLLDIMEVPQAERKMMLDWVNLMDSHRAKLLRESKPKTK